MTESLGAVQDCYARTVKLKGEIVLLGDHTIEWQNVIIEENVFTHESVANSCTCHYNVHPKLP